jgi:hypothetical protein
MCTSISSLGSKGPAAVSVGRNCCREESDAVASDPRDEVISVGPQASNRLAVGIVGVDHEVARHQQSQGVQEHDHLVQQGPPIAVRKHRPFVNATGQGQGEYAGQGLSHHGDGLAGVAEDILRLGV